MASTSHERGMVGLLKVSGGIWWPYKCPRTGMVDFEMLRDRYGGRKNADQMYGVDQR